MAKNVGGVATQKGINYQNRVAAWFCVRILAEQDAEPLWGWSSSSTIDWLRCETEQPIDDLLIGNSHQGLAFINIKHKINASQVAESSLASAIGQFVRQFVSTINQNNGPLLWERPLDLKLDRFVLVTNSNSSGPITSALPKVLERLRAPGFGGSLDDAAQNRTERETVPIIRAHLEREWLAVTGQSLGEGEAISLLKLVWVEVLDVDNGEAEERRAKEILRVSVLADPDQAEMAWHTLIQFCSVFASEQSGADRQALRDGLLKAGVKLKSSRSYRNDIELLKGLSQETLESLLPLSQITVKFDENPIKINRDCTRALAEASEVRSYVAVGEPGAGKSGVLHDVVQKWITDEGRDVVFIAVDRLYAKSLKSLRHELGLEHEIVNILQNWSGDKPAFLVINALDAARSGEKEQTILDLISRVHDLVPRWHIIASIRQFDLRHNTKLQSLFRGHPHPTFHSDEFSLHNTSHFNIRKLEPQELDQIPAQSAELGELVRRADDKLLDLLRIPFNLKLMAELIGSGVSVDDLTPIRTQIQLLERYWQERIVQPLDKRDAKELILSRAVGKMVESRSLRTDRSNVVTQTADGPVLTDILSANVLAEWSPHISRRVNDKFLTFAHHVLFDYAVARLLLRKEFPELIALLEQDTELVIAIRPSLVMHFEYELMHDLNRFWRLVFQVIRSPHLPEISKLIGPSVAVESLSKIEDFSPLIEALKSQNADERESAQKTFRHISGALMVTATAVREQSVRPARPDWSELIDLATDSINATVAYSSRPLLHVLCSDPEQLNERQRLFTGRAARKIFNFALSQEPREPSLVISGIELVCRTYESSPTESASLLHRCLTTEHVQQYGYEELSRFAEEVKRLVHVAPDLVEDIYRVTFTVNDLSDEKTDMGVSRIVAMSSTRRQDYHMARWKLAQDFQEFLKAAPLNAVRALVAAVNTYSEERYSTRWFISDEEKVTRAPEEPFEFDGKTGFLRVDHSGIWDEGAGSGDDEPVQMLHEFRNYLAEISAEDSNAELRQQIIDSIVAENRTPALWRQLIKVAIESPQTLGLEMRSLCWTLPFLMSDDTSQPMGELLKAVFTYLDPIERERVERAILSISESACEEKKHLEYRRNCLLGCLPEEALVTAEAKDTLRNLKQANQIPSNEPRSGLSVWGGSYSHTDEDYLREQGVPVEEKASRRLQQFTQPVKEFADAFRNSDPSISEVEAVIPSLREMHSALESAGQSAIHERQQSLSWGYLSSACEAATKCGDLNCESESGAFIKSVLLDLADHPEPAADSDDGHFDQVQSWGPSPRIDAAQGLLNLARREPCMDENLSSKIELLKMDPVPAVRFQVAANLTNLYYTNSDFMWHLIAYFSREEQSKGVLKWLVMASLDRLAAYHPDQVAEYAQIIFERIQEGEGADEVRKNCASIFAGLYVWHGHTLCQTLIDRIASDLLRHSPEAHQIVFSLRSWLNEGTTDTTESRENLARKRSFLVMEKILRSAFDHIHAFEEKSKGIPFASWTQEEQEAARSLAHLVDSVCMQMYFASGAYRDASDQKINRGDQERNQYLENALPILRLLSEYGHPSTAYHLCQTLEYLLPYDPAEVFLLIGETVKQGKKGGYQFESMAVDLIVQIVERFIAEYRSVLQQNKDCRQALIDILDVFVDAGWASARRLTYRMEEIFR